MIEHVERETARLNNLGIDFDLFFTTKGSDGTGIIVSKEAYDCQENREKIEAAGYSEYKEEGEKHSKPYGSAKKRRFWIDDETLEQKLKEAGLTEVPVFDSPETIKVNL